MSSTTTTKAIPIPKEWPEQVQETYKPVRVLGKGGFGSVMLARHVTNKSTVAMKIVAHGTTQESLYAQREVDILTQLKHDNIMKVVDSWESGKSMLLALSYAAGPTVQALVDYGGALSTTFSRVVSAQLIDALTYLHAHAVIHRDIKPDNLVVTGASSKDDSIWDNLQDQSTEPVWPQLLQKWHVTLIDFGFARALTEDDVKRPTLKMRRENVNASFHGTIYNLDSSRGSYLGSSRASSDLSSSGRKRSSLIRGSISISRHMTRKMSALGNRNFAAPEILKVKQEVPHDATISEFVAEYGLLVDAYSLGCTIRYMMTGVPPHERVEDYIAAQNSVCLKIARALGCGKPDPNKRQPHYRLETSLPADVQRMIKKLTERLEQNRTSVREARRYPWVSTLMTRDHEDGCEEKDYTKGILRYLKSSSVVGSDGP